jgi:hypothetical protein
MSRVVVLAAAGLTAPAAFGQTGDLVTNQLVPPPPTVKDQAYDPTKDEDAGYAAGRFYFTAEVCNDPTLNPLAVEQGVGLESRTVEITGGNIVLNRIPGGAPGDPAGVGSIVDFPADGQYLDLVLAEGECVDVDFVIGLATINNFYYFVDFWRDPLGQATVPVTITTGREVDVCGGSADIDANRLNVGFFENTVNIDVEPAVRVTSIEPEPNAYVGGTSAPPLGCGERTLAQYEAATLPTELTVQYDCTCP